MSRARSLARAGAGLRPGDDVPPDSLPDSFEDVEDRSAAAEIGWERAEAQEPDWREHPEQADQAVAEGGSGLDLAFHATPASLEAGASAIRRAWATLPASPGVYRMLDARGDVLYVGKAKNLKARVGAYARGQAPSTRITRMIAETASMEFVTTATETEALLLEANLIKQLRPRYNVVMRDDKSLPYILLTADGPVPQIVKHRGARNRKGHYFGPFASVWAVNRTVNALQRAFLLRTCSDSYYDNRTRPCLLFQIKRCSGPCTGEIAPEDYETLAESARAFLSGRSSAVKEGLAAEMARASDELEFERAARYRDRLAALSAVQSTQGVNTQGIEEADVFALDEQAGQFCVEVFFFRNHQNWGNRAYFPRADRSISRAEVMAAFLAQFYDDKPPPRLVLVSEEIEEAALLADALAVKAGRKVELATPKRGERRQLVENACRNAKEALGRRLAETSSQAKLLASLGQAFGLPRAPRRIEVYDNSHIMGTNAVGAMIVAGPSGFMRTHYRTFNMRSEDLTPGDDFAMMKEMLTRRFARLAKENPRASAISSPLAGEVDGAQPRPEGGRAAGTGTGSSCTTPTPTPPRKGEGDARLEGDNRPHAEVLAHEGEPRSTREGGASFEAPLRGAPQDEDGGAIFGSRSTDAEGASFEASLREAPQDEEDGEADGDAPADEAFPAWPDLVLIDGGKGQLEAARAALAAVGVTDVPLVGVAKGRDRDAGRETFFLLDRPPIRMPPRDPALYFVQRLRDEAHRFAIGTHRAKRKREMTKSPLDEIPGIGPTRKRALLHHFGTMKAIERAALPDLMGAPGVNAATAKAVYAYFHPGA